MPAIFIHLIDKQGSIIGKVEVESIEGQLVMGKLIEHHFSIEMQQLFRDFQNIVEQQLFSLLDEITAWIECLEINAVFLDSGQSVRITDLQVYDMELISFRMS